jgi:hypothetical protein
MNRFGWLLVIFLLQLLTLPLFEGTLAAGSVPDILFLLLLGAAAYAVRDNPFFRWAIVLGAASCIGIGMFYLLHSTAAMLITGGVYLAYLALVIVLIVTELVRDAHINADHVMGGLCVYILLGIFFSLLFSLIEQAWPGSFNFGQHGQHPDLINLTALLYYYSFVNLMTIGFGDVVPMSHMAQTLSILEGLLGQFYLVFFMASLVGRYISRRQRP